MPLNTAIATTQHEQVLDDAIVAARRYTTSGVQFSAIENIIVSRNSVPVAAGAYALTLQGEVPNEVLITWSANTGFEPGDIITIQADPTVRLDADFREHFIRSELNLTLYRILETVKANLTPLGTKNIEQDARLDANDDKNTERDARLDAAEVKNAQQDERLDTNEAKNVEQDSRIDGLVSAARILGEGIVNNRDKNIQQDTALATLTAQIEGIQTGIVGHSFDADTSILTLNFNDGSSTRIDFSVLGIAAIAELADRLTAVETKNTEQDTAITAVETKNTEQDTAITAVETKNTEQDNRLTAVETKNTEQDTAITAVETKNTEQDTAITAVETKNTEQDNRIAANDNRLTLAEAALAGREAALEAVQQKNLEQDLRLDTAETKNTEQDTRLTAVEARNTAQDDVDTAHNTRITATETKDAAQDIRLTATETKDAAQDTRLDAIEAKDTEQDTAIAAINAQLDGIQTGISSYVYDATTTTLTLTFNDGSTVEIDFGGLSEAAVQGIMTRLTALETASGAHGTRITAVEAANTGQNRRLDAIEALQPAQTAKDNSQDDRLTAVERADGLRDTRLDGHGSRITIAEAKNTEQDKRLTALDGGVSGDDDAGTRIQVIETIFAEPPPWYMFNYYYVGTGATLAEAVRTNIPGAGLPELINGATFANGVFSFPTVGSFGAYLQTGVSADEFIHFDRGKPRQSASGDPTGVNPDLLSTVKIPDVVAQAFVASVLERRIDREGGGRENDYLGVIEQASNRDFPATVADDEIFSASADLFYLRNGDYEASFSVRRWRQAAVDTLQRGVSGAFGGLVRYDRASEGLLSSNNWTGFSAEPSPTGSYFIWWNAQDQFSEFVRENHEDDLTGRDPALWKLYFGRYETPGKQRSLFVAYPKAEFATVVRGSLGGAESINKWASLPDWNKTPPPRSVL